MSTSSINSISSTSSSEQLRYTGLASGIDTDEIVEKLTATSQNKIDKVKQQQQLLEWKQEDYREIISSVNSFYNKYFSTASSSSILMSSFYSVKSSTSSNANFANSVSVTANAGSNVSSITLSNVSVATAAKAKSASSICSPITLDFAQGETVDLTGKSMEITVDGMTKTITFDKAYSSADELAADMKSLTDTVFGEDRLTFSVNSGKILVNSDGASVSINQTEGDAFSSDALSLEVSSTSRLSLSASLDTVNFATALEGDTFEFSINGVDFSFDKSASMNDIMSAINKSDAGVKVAYSSVTDKLSFTATDTGAANGIDIQDKTGNLMGALVGELGADNYTAGKDASIYIDGVKVTRSSNSFTIDGISYNLKSDTTESTTISIENDVDAVYNNIKNFVTDYNALLDKLNGVLNEERFSDYAPLTEAQKNEMSESQIEAWEKKASSGLLRNDTTISSLVSTLRTTMYSALEGSDVNINSIGITTGSWQDRGKLAIDETKLREAIANDPDKIQSLFAQSSDVVYNPNNTAEQRTERYNESGIMQRLGDVLQDYGRTTQGGGSLLQVAGYKGTTTETNNTITRSIQAYEQRLDRLLDMLERERDRYYAQFSRMETYLEQMNQQSATITSYLGGY